MGAPFLASAVVIFDLGGCAVLEVLFGAGCGSGSILCVLHSINMSS